MTQPFHVPDGRARRAAIGPVAGLPASLRRALTPGRDFRPMRSPRPGDWLAEYGERGQTYEDFVRSHPRRPDGAHRKIAVQPIGVFDPDGSPPIFALRRYVELFFGLAGEVLPPLSPADHEFTSRINPVTKKPQLHAGEVLHYLWRTIPPDAFCIIAVTQEDLYPDPEWNYVFGQASLTERVGVVSFARYDPAFFGRRRNAAFHTTSLRRSGKVICHETGHMLGLEHCIFFRCVMNGGNNLRESDARPMHACPVCLRKLQHSLGFDVVHRYEGLVNFYAASGLDREAKWVEKRLRFIAGRDGA